MTAAARCTRALLAVALACAAASCGQQGPLVLPDSARPVERLPQPPAGEPEQQDDEHRDER